MRRELNMEVQKEHFKDHVATLIEYNNIKVLDFKNPNTNNYRIRFVFEEDYCNLHISGDLGYLSASNYNNMTYNSFSDFVNNIGYFEEKIQCHSRPLHYYDYGDAFSELQERIKDGEYTKEELLDAIYSYDTEKDMDNVISDVIDEILSDFDDTNGISQEGYEVLERIDPDCFEWAGNLGLYSSGILELYMLAFKLATEQLKNVEPDCVMFI